MSTSVFKTVSASLSMCVSNKSGYYKPVSNRCLRIRLSLLYEKSVSDRCVSDSCVCNKTVFGRTVSDKCRCVLCVYRCLKSLLPLKSVSDKFESPMSVPVRCATYKCVSYNKCLSF